VISEVDVVQDATVVTPAGHGLQSERISDTRVQVFYKTQDTFRIMPQYFTSRQFCDTGNQAESLTFSRPVSHYAAHIV
jgi:hypothetical protein